MDIYEKIYSLSNTYEKRLKERVDARVLEMDNDDYSHHILYQVLGVSPKEGHDIDVYQNKGRFLYKYAGSFLEEAAFMCMKERFPDASKTRIDNTLGSRPRKFEIDSLVESHAFEIKWRDATTDGDHITKEHTRIRVIHAAGYIPVRVMFYYPNRDQAKKIQIALESLYRSLGGQYYYGNNAWAFIKDYTGVDLLDIIERIAKEKTKNGV
ncbi:ApaLI family restriction endonuclease [Rosenbergiella epipactidis]|uniref:ApaLI family restriction endonuclease n=1 Tax=Rosenbergiella epipactidis TaxID=1544694 RepID=UPI001F4F04AB|nr:ApaLI family restriction endonuclease [Rosenbergiella epipactidis]